MPAFGIIDVPMPRAAADEHDRVPEKPARVLLVSPDRLGRLAWASSISAHAGCRPQVEEVHSAAAAEALIRSTGPPRLVLLDLRGGDAGVERLMELVADHAATGTVRVVAIGPADRVDHVQRLLKHGAGGYLFTTPRRTTHQPTRTLDEGAATRDLVLAAPTDRGDTIEVANSDGVPCRLSRREVEILQHVAEGKPNTAIAQALGLSTFTVKSHLSRIGRRLGTGERGHLVYLALRAGAIE